MIETLAQEVKIVGPRNLRYTLYRTSNDPRNIFLCVTMLWDGINVSRTISDFAEDEKEARRFFRWISSGIVTPETLADIAEDYVQQKTTPAALQSRPLTFCELLF